VEEIKLKADLSEPVILPAEEMVMYFQISTTNKSSFLLQRRKVYNRSLSHSIKIHILIRTRKCLVWTRKSFLKPTLIPKFHSSSERWEALRISAVIFESLQINSGNFIQRLALDMKVINQVECKKR